MCQLQLQHDGVIICVDLTICACYQAALLPKLTCSYLAVANAVWEALALKSLGAPALVYCCFMWSVTKVDVNHSKKSAIAKQHNSKPAATLSLSAKTEPFSIEL